MDTAPMRKKLLIVDDDAYSSAQLRRLLESEELSVEVVSSGQEALAQLLNDDYSVMITDLRMPGMGGMELIREINQRRLLVTTIVTTGFGSIERVVEAMRLGAYDFLTKPIDPTYLKLVMDRALKKRALQDEVVNLRQQLKENYSFHSIISKSPRMHKIFELVRHIAGTKSTVLIEGETGTGKELIAKAVHFASEVRGPLVAINCAALPETLLESELFGHEKGAFTNADRQRLGRFELAAGGTLLLDEIGEMPLGMQAKLLRVLQDGAFTRVGGTETLRADTRLVAATNVDLAAAVAEGRFREDLFFRLNVVTIDLPPLRERDPENVPLLLEHFLERLAGRGYPVKTFARETIARLGRYLWPGNIRELEHLVEQLVVTTPGPVVRPEDLPPQIVATREEPFSLAFDLSRPLQEITEELVAQAERVYLRRVLEKYRGRIDACAAHCGLSRRSISEKLRRHRIDKADFKPHIRRRKEAELAQGQG